MQGSREADSRGTETRGGSRGWESASDSCPGHSQEMQTAKLLDKLACPYFKEEG